MPKLRTRSLAVLCCFLCGAMLFMAPFSAVGSTAQCASDSAQAASTADAAANAIQSTELSADASQDKVVKVAWWAFSGMNDTDSKGNPCGYNYEYLEAIAQYTGWEYEFVPVTLDEGYAMIESGELDLMGCIAYNEDRAQKIDYSEQSSGVGGNRLICRSEDDRFSYGDLDAIDGKIVATQAGSTRQARMEAYCEKYGFQVNFVEAEDEDALFKLLDEEKVDLVLWSQAWSDADYRSVLDFDQRPFYFVVSKKSPDVLLQLDSAMGQIKAGQPDFDSQLRDKYFSTYTSLSPSFTKEEEAYIKAHPDIVVSYDPSWRPIEYKDKESGSIGGMMKDVYALLSERTGINFIFVTSEDFSDVYKDYRGKSQISSVLCYDFDWGKTWNVRFTPPLFDVQLECISSDEDGNAVALPTDYYVTNYVKNTYTDSEYEYQYYDTVQECMDAVRRGDADKTFINSLELSYYLSIPKYTQLHFQAMPGVTLRYAIGVSKDEDTLLFSIMSKAIGNISDAEMSQIISSNTVNSYRNSLLDFIYINPILTLFVMIVPLMAVLAAVAFYRRNRLVRVESRKMEEVNKRLIRASSAKSEFLSRMSHDIRTPMNGIIGMTQIAQEDPDKTADCLKKIDVSSKYLLGLINDILDMSKIESGEITLHPEAYTPEDFTQYVDSVIRPLCEGKKQTLSVVRHFPPAAENYVVMIDKLRANQILFNLLSNASKYTPEGGRIECSLSIVRTPEKKADLKFVVKDNGRGMSKTFQKIMFEPFSQEDQVRNNESTSAGSGLGLSIVKKIIELMGGRIEVESKEGEGSTFTVTALIDTMDAAAFNQIQKKAALVVNDEVLMGRRILVCEDNSINQEIVKTVLERKKMAVSMADNGQMGARLFEASAPFCYDAILMDIRMPLMDGYETTHAIREMEREDAHMIPIIAMTADAFEEDMQKCLDAGMNAHIAKPIDPNRLYGTLCSWITLFDEFHRKE